ncbi:MAG: tRNA (adenosine(37)-N6)-threonylcarbamoyltransferase complex ATPase subunit type 1 TsaE [Betaproteobacteria bacterium]|nr:tRNA (adenosine(37)-N6)-threonylcarbamoyltransferase complex ATPase subunit type 1 TsaE [Betaproteobacteria bacterium]
MEHKRGHPMIVDRSCIRFNSVDEQRLGALAAAIGSLCPKPVSIISLRGHLGSGKTTFARALLRALGIEGRIKSPSFSVAEQYEATFGPIHHLDLYRLDRPDAWRAAGLREILSAEGLCLIEWPERAEGLPAADLDILFEWAQEGSPEGPRRITLQTPKDPALLEQLARVCKQPAGAEPSDRRELLLGLGATLLIGLVSRPARAVDVLGVRIWPASDYTRVTIEHDTADLVFRTQLLTEPDRLVVDIDGMTLNPTLRELVARVANNDPYIAALRVGQFKPGVVRMVFDLRQPIRPQVYSMPPVAQYRHRLVVDLLPAQEQDPLMSFLQSYEQKKSGPNAGDAPVQRLVTIALDPGHGGEDPGAIGKRGTREKDVVLRMAQALKKEIDAQPAMRAYLTRDADYFVPLGKRVEKARRVRADLFVSIHADAWVSPKAQGSSVYVLSEHGATSAAARWMARKENESDKIGGFSWISQDRQLAQTLLDMSTTAQIKDSIRLARAVLGEIGDINSLHKRQVEQAGFAVLKAPDIPSVLVETAFISNPEEELRLRDDRYQQQMAKALLRGIRRYLAQNPPLSKSGLT